MLIPALLPHKTWGAPLDQFSVEPASAESICDVIAGHGHVAFVI